MADIYNFTDGSISGQMIPKEKFQSRKALVRTEQNMDNRLFLLRNEVDFSNQTLDVSETDVARVLNIPAGVTVIDAWCKVITAETADSLLNFGYGSDIDYWGHLLAMDTAANTVIPTVLAASATWDAGSISEAKADTAAEEAKEITVDGAQLGELCQCYMSIDVTDLSLTAQVTAANTVTAQILNLTGGDLDLGSGTFTVVVDKAPLRNKPVYFASADTIDFSGASTVDIDGLKVEVCALCYKVL